MVSYPLEGVRVLDLCQAFAGSFGTFILADLGAEVIKVESTRHWQAVIRGQQARPSKALLQRTAQGVAGYYQDDPGKRPWERYSQLYASCRNKLGMTVDLMRPEGVSIFKRLIKITDVFIEGNSPEVVEKLGIDYPQLKEVKPDLIMVRMPGYGLSGPYRNLPAFGPHLEAFCGHTLMRGYLDMDASSTPSVIASDAAAGAAAGVAALMALHYRRRTGKGQLIELAQLENFIPQIGEAFMDYIFNRRVPTALGNRHPSAAPCGCYPCQGQDRWVNITVHNDEEWEGLRRALGDPAWAREPSLDTVLGRHQNQDELDKHLSEWTQSRSPYEVMELLQREGVPSGPVLDSKDVFDDPHLRERGHFQEITHPEVGTYVHQGVLWRMSRTPLRIRRPAPLLGQHNPYVYKELLGFSEEEYARLEREGHIGNEFIPELP